MRGLSWLCRVFGHRYVNTVYMDGSFLSEVQYALQQKNPTCSRCMVTRGEEFA